MATWRVTVSHGGPSALHHHLRSLSSTTDISGTRHQVPGSPLMPCARSMAVAPARTRSSRA